LDIAGHSRLVIVLPIFIFVHWKFHQKFGHPCHISKHVVVHYSVCLSHIAMSEHQEVIVIDSDDEEPVPQVPLFASMPNLKRDEEDLMPDNPVRKNKKLKTSPAVNQKTISLKDELNEFGEPKYEIDKFGAVRYEIVVNSISDGTYKSVPMLVKTEAQKKQALATKLRRERGMGEIEWQHAINPNRSIDDDVTAALVGLLQNESTQPPKVEGDGVVLNAAVASVTQHSVKSQLKLEDVDSSK
jgi:hypothetical protein